MIPSDDRKLDLYEFRSEKEIITFGKGICYEIKPNTERLRVLQLKEQTR